ncbi:hypothetical protein [Noviherbaspirillum humi]|uniref:hypothetical protein n=1 Tax=Noviherbaspirillum humi TaxID=1688639 RepID=UPI001C3D35A5|nr:hypothetical protein [Noviherbaspirillum humi]
MNDHQSLLETMDILTFISELAKALAWPAAVVFLAFMLKNPLTELIPLLRRLKYKELEMEFAKEVADLKASVAAPEPTPVEGVVSKPTDGRLLQLANFSPRAAIMEAWIEVETAANEVASSFWNQGPSEIMRNYSRLGEYLLQCKVLSSTQLETFNKLRHLRNKAAHAEELDLSETDARAYVELATALAAHIRSSR